MPITGLSVRWGAVVAAFLMLGGAAEAALRSDERKCQRSVARAGARYAKRSAALLAACHDRVSRGALPAPTDCRAEAATKLAGEATRLGQRIARRCRDSTVARLVFGRDCLGVSTTPALVACIEATHDADVDALMGVLYPVGGGALSPEGRRCQVLVSKQTRKSLANGLRHLQRCKNDAAVDRLPTGTQCAADPPTVAKLATQHGKAADKIETRCDDAALAAVAFGPPCATPATGEALAECVGAVGDSGRDQLLIAEYGESLGFCGDSFQAVEVRIDEILSQMTLAEKVEQMHGTSPLDAAWLTPENDRLGIPGFRMMDGPRGAGVVAGNATAFPVGMARGSTWDPDLEQRVGAAMGAEVRAKGNSVLLAPTINLLRHPRWGRAQETYGEDPLHLGRMGAGFIRGVQAQRVIASAKHYAANSIEDTRFAVDVTVDERTLREIYLPHFRMAVEDARVGSVMSAYNQVNGLYCDMNPPLLMDILKGEWGFTGFVESDWIFGTHSTIDSVLAGLDIEMPFPVYFGPPLEAAVDAGDVPEETVDAAVRRVLRAKLCFRLDDDPPAPNPALIETQEHTDLALEVAQKGIVLLKNDGPVLPLDRATLQDLVVVGPLADLENLGDSGSSDVEPSYAITPLEGLQNRAGAVAVTHVPAGLCAPAAGDRIACTAAPLSAGEEATIAAADAAIVVLGLTEADEGESFVGAGDRDMLPLSSDQEQLIADVAALNPATIVVLEGGASIVVENWVDDVEGILMAWYPGQEGGHAIADLLFGDVNPSGRLAISFPRAESDLPPFINNQTAVTYDYYHGYRHLDRNLIDPRFPFGFGLSYTTYAYSNLSVSAATIAVDGMLQITADVTNTGAVAGDETVQLYVSYMGSSVDRPVVDLKGFERVHLEPGETRTVSLDLPVEDLAYYDAGSAAWVVEAISYGVHVGSSSRDLPLTGSFQVQ